MYFGTSDPLIAHDSINVLILQQNIEPAAIPTGTRRFSRNLPFGPHLSKEIIALAVSATNGCTYCINSHTAAVQKLGLDTEGLAEVLAVVGLYNQMNKLADAYQVEPDVLPNL